MHSNKEQVTELITQFEILSKMEFSGKREHSLDDLFANFMRLKLSSGAKNFKDETHAGVRTRCFTYTSDDGKTFIEVKVKIFQGRKGESVFTSKAEFSK